MATTVRLTALVKEPAPSTRVRVRFSNGDEQEFPSLADCLAWATSADLDRGLTERLCVAYAAARSADLSNVASVLNKDFIFDLSAAAPIKVQ